MNLTRSPNWLSMIAPLPVVEPHGGACNNLPQLQLGSC